MCFLFRVWKESELILSQEDLALGVIVFFLTIHYSRLPENVVFLPGLGDQGTGLLG